MITLEPKLLMIPQPCAPSRPLAKTDLALDYSFPDSLPDPFVIEAAIARKIPVLTTSYISPDMQAQHERCVEAGIPVLNEIGEF